MLSVKLIVSSHAQRWARSEQACLDQALHKYKIILNSIETIEEDIVWKNIVLKLKPATQRWS